MGHLASHVLAARPLTFTASRCVLYVYLSHMLNLCTYQVSLLADLFHGHGWSPCCRANLWWKDKDLSIPPPEGDEDRRECSWVVLPVRRR